MGSAAGAFFFDEFPAAGTGIAAPFVVTAVGFLLVCEAVLAFFSSVFFVVLLIAIISPVINLISLPKQFLFSQ
jgi:hypothetical protein